ncbi:uncharacterized protein [Hoplias malabaricus]|uniref:uncharacterized protein n=1 Tax=Hoplias malabaricus TaxID=27720 RepID=UPI0034626BC3
MALSQIRRFLIFSGEGHLLKGGFAFLQKHENIRLWVNELKRDQFKPTTIKINLLNLKSFFSFLSNFPTKLTHVTACNFNWLKIAISQQLKELKRDLTSHLQNVRKLSSKKLVSKEDMVAYRREARILIPKKLEQLRKTRTRACLQQVFGLMAGYFVVGTGHRTGVLTNLTVKEVTDAESGEGGSVVIEVAQHKSASTYGFAQLCLSKEEFSWFTTLLEIRIGLEGAKSKFFFFTASGGRCVKLLLYFQTEWTRMGFGRRFNFRHFRTTMVHHTKNLSPTKKRRIHKAMCHSEAVAEKFYMPLNNPKEAAEVAAIQLAAIDDCALATLSCTESPIGPEISQPARTEVAYSTSSASLSSVRRPTKRRLDYSDLPSTIHKRATIEHYESDSSSSEDDTIRRPVVLESDTSEGVVTPNKTGLLQRTPIKAMLGTQSMTGHEYAISPTIVMTAPAHRKIMLKSPMIKLYRCEGKLE